MFCSMMLDAGYYLITRLIVFEKRNLSSLVQPRSGARSRQLSAWYGGRLFIAVGKDAAFVEDGDDAINDDVDNELEGLLFDQGRQIRDVNLVGFIDSQDDLNGAGLFLFAALDLFHVFDGLDGVIKKLKHQRPIESFFEPFHFGRKRK